jgi:hypothetical protein
MNIQESLAEHRAKTPEKPLLKVVPYSEFLKTNSAEVGTVIIDVEPRDLFTYQDWIDIAKVENVMTYYLTNDPRLSMISGYLHFHTKFRRNVIVVGNGNHRGLFALIKHRKIDVTIEEEPQSDKPNPFKLSNLLKKYGDPFSGLTLDIT